MASPAAPTSPAAAPLRMHVNVQTVFGQTVSVVVPKNGDVSLLKDAIAAKLNIDSEHQHVLFAGRELDQLAESLESVGLRDGSTVTVTPVAKSGPINYRNVPWPSRGAAAAAAANGSAGSAGVVGEEERRLPRAVLRTMSPAARAQVIEATKPVTIAAVVDQALVVISIPPGELTAADLEGLDDPPAGKSAPAAAPASTPDVDLEAANAAMRSKVERLKQQMRLKKLAREGGVPAVPAKPAEASEAPSAGAVVAAPTPKTATAAASAAGKRAASPARSRSPSPMPFGGLRRGFLLSPRSPPPPPRSSGASTPMPSNDSARAAARRTRSSTVGAQSRPPGSTAAGSSSGTGFAGLRRGFLLRQAAPPPPPKRSQTMAALTELQRDDDDDNDNDNDGTKSAAASRPLSRADSMMELHGAASPADAPMDVDVAVAPPPATAAPAARPTCDHCHRKLGLTAGYDCRCGHHFCARHRFPEDHACQFDHRAAGRQQLMDANPMVVAPKVNKW